MIQVSTTQGKIKIYLHTVYNFKHFIVHKKNIVPLVMFIKNYLLKIFKMLVLFVYFLYCKRFFFTFSQSNLSPFKCFSFLPPFMIPSTSVPIFGNSYPHLNKDGERRNYVNQGKVSIL